MSGTGRTGCLILIRDRFNNTNAWISHYPRCYLLFFILFALFVINPAYSELSGQPCIEAEYSGWRCHQLTLTTIENTNFSVRLRWNRPSQNNLATVVWLAGGNGSKPHSQIDSGIAGAADPRSIRTKLDQDKQIRSIEIQFLNPPDTGDASGGYWAAPRQGYLKAAQAYQQTLDYLRRSDINLVQGEWLTQVGSSNGATVLAFTLAYLNAADYSSRMVLVSGPFVVDILRECSDPGFIAYTGHNDTVNHAISGSDIRALLSLWNGWPDCAALNSVEPRRSTLGPLAQQNFPDTEIAVVMGLADAFAPWILRSNDYWYNVITAHDKQRFLVDNVDHDVFAANAATDLLLFDLISRTPQTGPQTDLIWSDGFEP